MKITQAHQDKLEELLASNTMMFDCLSIKDFVRKFKLCVAEGSITVKKCEATNCFSRLLIGEALRFVCDEIYNYADDSHLTTFYKKLYKKYS